MLEMMQIELIKERRNLQELCRALWRTRTADPLSMKEGRGSTDACFLHRPVMVGGVVEGREQRSSLYRLLVWEDQAGSELAPVAHLLKDRQAARGSVAPAGAKGWLRVSMCQIASASRRARSTWATLAPRCLPSRCLVRW